MSDLEAIKSRFEALRPVMDERMRRLWAAAEARAAELENGRRSASTAARGGRRQAGGKPGRPVSVTGNVFRDVGLPTVEAVPGLIVDDHGSIGTIVED